MNNTHTHIHTHTHTKAEAVDINFTEHNISARTSGDCFCKDQELKKSKKKQGLNGNNRIKFVPQSIICIPSVSFTSMVRM